MKPEAWLGKRTGGDVEADGEEFKFGGVREPKYHMVQRSWLGLHLGLKCQFKVLMGKLVLGPKTEDRLPDSRLLRIKTVLEGSSSCSQQRIKGVWK